MEEAAPPPSCGTCMPSPTHLSGEEAAVLDVEGGERLVVCEDGEHGDEAGLGHVHAREHQLVQRARPLAGATHHAPHAGQRTHTRFSHDKRLHRSAGGSTINPPTCSSSARSKQPCLSMGFHDRSRCVSVEFSVAACLIARAPASRIWLPFRHSRDSLQRYLPRFCGRGDSRRGQAGIREQVAQGREVTTRSS